MLSGLVNMAPVTRAQGTEPMNLTVVNLGQTAFGLVWVTTDNVTGYINWGEGTPDTTAYDVQDPGDGSYSGTVHFVMVDNLSASTTYTFEIVSGGTTYSGSQLPFSTVTTLPPPDTPPSSYIVYGQVFRSDGTTPAAGTLAMANTTGAVWPIAVLTDSSGNFSLNIGELKAANGSSVYTGSAIDLSMVFEGGYWGNLSTVVSGAGGGESPENIGTFTLLQGDLYLSSSDIVVDGVLKVGYSITINATIHNQGNVGLLCDVEFYDDTSLISTDSGISVAAGGTSLATCTWSPSTNGTHTITVKIVNVNRTEASTTNNQASVDVNIEQANEPNMYIDSGNITLTPSSPVIGDTVTIKATVSNIGNVDGTCNVSFWDGPSDTGTLIGENTSVSISAGASVDLYQTYTLSDSRTYTITVSITDVSPQENATGDNEASITVTPRQPDLAVADSDISFNPSVVGAGDSFTVVATVHNYGDADGGGNVTFYLGSISPGNEIGTVKSTGTVPAGGSVNVVSDSTSISTVGTYDIYVVVSDVSPLDADSSNQQAHATLDVLSPNPDIKVVSVYAPSPLPEDEPATFYAEVKNLGAAQADSFNVSFYLDSTSGELIGTTQHLALGGGASANISSPQWTPTGKVGTHVVVAVVWDVKPSDDDSSNNQGTSNSFEVTQVPPRVTDSDPINGATDVPTSTSITIVFSTPMNTTSVENYFSMYPSASPGAIVDGSFAWYDGATRLVFTPSSSLEYKTDYTVKITGSARNHTGVNLDGDGDKVWEGASDNYYLNFTTRLPPDTKGPVTTIATVDPNPTGSAQYVYLNATVNDTTTGGSQIAEAEYFLADSPGANGTGTSMSFVDGEGDSPVEEMTATININSLMEGQDYTIWVHGRDVAGNWGDFYKVTFHKSDLNPPTNETGDPWEGLMSAVDVQYGGAVSLSWKAADDPTGPITYNIYVSTVHGGQDFSTPDFTYTPYPTPIPGDTVTYTVEGLVNGQTYYFVVRAEDAEGNEDTNTVEISAMPTDQEPPSFGGIYSATNVGDGASVNISWYTANDNNTDPDQTIYYLIYYAKSGFVLDFSKQPNETVALVEEPNKLVYHVVTGLEPGEQYDFVVLAEDASGNRANTINSLTVTTADYTPPSFAGVETGTDLGTGGSVRLTWSSASDPSTPVTYWVYISTQEGVWNTSQPNYTTTSTSIQINGLHNLPDGQYYYFMVWAVDSVGNVNQSDAYVSVRPTDVTPPDFQGIDMITDTGVGGELTITWFAAVDSDTSPEKSISYEIWRDGTKIATVTGATSYTDSGLVNGQTYTYVVRAVDASGNYKASDAVTSPPPSDTTPPSLPASIWFNDTGEEGKVSVEFTEALDANTDPTAAPLRYVILRDGVEVGNITFSQQPFYDTGLSIGVQYTYKLRVIDGSGNYVTSGEYQVTPTDTLPPRFNGVGWVNDTSMGGEIEVSWEPAEDISTPVMYAVYMDTDPAFTPNSTNMVASGVTGTSYTVTGLINGQTYYFVVRATDSLGNSEANTVKKYASPTDTTPPVFAGLGTAADMGTYGEVNLTWSPAEDNSLPVTYLIYYSTSTSDLFTSVKATTEDTWYTVSGLNNGVKYYFAVRAKDAEGNMETNKVIKSATPTDQQPPEFSGLQSVAPVPEGGALLLSWQPAYDESGQITYYIYRSTSNDIVVDPEQSPTSSPYFLATTTQTTYLDDNRGDYLINGRTYYYLVRAVDGSQQMDNNTVVLDGTPQDVQPPVFSGVKSAVDLETGGAIKVTWDAGQDRYGVEYNVYRSTDPQVGPSSETLIAGGITGTEYTDTGLVNGQTYYYWVRARDSNGNMETNDKSVSATPSDKTPPTFQGVSEVYDTGVGGELVIRWSAAQDSDTDPNAGITYYVFRSTSYYFSTDIGSPYQVATTTATSYTDTGLQNGVIYYYKVRAVDRSGNMDQSTVPPVSGVPTRPNNPPSLTPVAGTPIIGALSDNTPVTFSVIYSDPDGDPPEYVKLVISGLGEYTLSASAGAGTDYVDGVIYEFDIFLGPGDYTYSFVAKDMPGVESREGGKTYTTVSYSLTVPQYNRAPVLSSPSVSPSSGTTDTTFTFTVVYTDADGDTPAGIYVVIDGEEHPLSLISGGNDFTQPATYSISLTLPAGKHTYYFSASDGQEEVTTDTGTITVLEEEQGGGGFSEFLNTEYYGIHGTAWLVIIIIIVLAVLVGAAMAGRPPEEPGAETAQGAEKVTITCPTCGATLEVELTERPMTVDCPVCHSKLQVE